MSRASRMRASATRLSSAVNATAQIACFFLFNGMAAVLPEPFAHWLLY